MLKNAERIFALEYILSFLEGIITFISPCLLPMLPIYVSYFAGIETQDMKKNALKNSIAFVAGFSVVFVLLGAFAATLGRILIRYTLEVNIITGLIVILFGLNFMGLVRIPFINTNKNLGLKFKTGFFSSFLFGVIFSIGWTPCVGTFLGSALMLAASTGHSIKGVLMLLSYSFGLGIPFIISAVLIDRLKTTFDVIKRHYKVINIIAGSLLVIIGLLMISGLMGKLLNILSSIGG